MADGKRTRRTYIAGFVFVLHLQRCLLLLLLLLAVSQAGKLATRVWPFTVVASIFLAISKQPNRSRIRYIDTSIWLYICVS